MTEANHIPIDLRGDEGERRENQIEVFSKAFLALTTNCARSHDHKFDAISTDDYVACAVDNSRADGAQDLKSELLERWVNVLQEANDDVASPFYPFVRFASKGGEPDAATLLHQLGLDHERLTFRYGGRDMRLTDVHGHVIREILA